MYQRHLQGVYARYISVRKVILRSKFTEQIFFCQWQDIIFKYIVKKHFHLVYAWENKWWVSFYQPTTLCATFFNRHESTLAEDCACLRQCRWSAPAPNRSRLARPYIIPPTMYSHLDSQGICPSLETECSTPLSYHVEQQKCTWHKPTALYIGLQISVYRKWALRLKILILYSQEFHRTKFISSRKWRNRPLFWPCAI